MVNAGRCCAPIGMPGKLVRLFMAGRPAKATADQGLTKGSTIAQAQVRCEAAAMLVSARKRLRDTDQGDE